MIKADGKYVAVSGEKDEIFRNLVYLHVAIMNSPDLMKMDLKAMDAAVDLIQNNELKATVVDGKSAIEELIRRINEGAGK